MDISTELRWFSKARFTDVEPWFESHGKKFKNEWQRSDFYVDLNGYVKLSFKIRDGKAEIKTLTESMGAFKLSEQCEGLVQRWLKWSKPLKSNLTAEAIFEKKNQLIELKKERLLITYSINKNDTFISTEHADEGCQVELTRIEINNEIFFSFAFEAFGLENNQIDNLNTVATQALNEANITKLSIKDSYDYPTLLAKMLK